jgi:stage II sporulation protein D
LVDRLTWWRKGVAAAWTGAGTKRRRGLARGSVADSIAASLIHRRRVSGLFVLALVAMGAVVSVLSCESTNGGIEDRTDTGKPVVSAPTEPNVRVRIRTRVNTAVIAAPQTISVRAEGTSLGAQILRAPISIAIGDEGLITTDGAGVVREWGLSVDLDLQAAAGDADRASMVVDGVAYPGRLTVRGKWREAGKGFDIISALPMETYIAGVLQKELYDGWPRQSYEAQAIAARSYATHERARARSSARQYDVESSTLDQAYGGLPTRTVAIEAARTTRGMLLMDDTSSGGVLRAYYSSCCGGRPSTAAAIWPTGPGFEFNRAIPLQGGSRAFACDRAPVFAWEVVRKNDELVRRFKAWGREVGKRLGNLDRIKSIQITERNAAGRPNAYTITDVRGQTFRLSGEEMRLACNEGDAGAAGTGAGALPDLRTGLEFVRSNDLEFTVAAPGSAPGGGEIRIKGRGFGHGVGMCQYCAKGFAERGQDAPTMLRLFYPGARIVKSY